MKNLMKIYFAYGVAASMLVSVDAMAGAFSPPAQSQSVQQQTTKGHVTDENGDPLVGVTVKILGATGGAVTDIEGNFTLGGAEGKRLQFSYAGYKTQTLMAGQGVMNVRM